MKIINSHARKPSPLSQPANSIAFAVILVLGWLLYAMESPAAIWNWSGGGGANAYWNNSANWGFAVSSARNGCNNQARVARAQAVRTKSGRLLFCMARVTGQ